MVEPIKSRDDVPKIIIGGSTLAVCTHFPQKLFHDVTFSRPSQSVASLFYLGENV